MAAAIFSKQTTLPASGTAINDGLQTTAAILHTFRVTDSDDAVTCFVRPPQNARFEVVAATSPVITLLPSTGTSINDGLQAAAAIIHTLNVTDSDDRRNPPFLNL
ncbi:hypothetical protein DPMN_019716 [Dreissena polymorpha]|uniref:Uncharacterized protein n=1 Tax=Dreissena polymorpha TaxID=45954 RepID=A0A9D4NIX6_DREPO|nr:hypothetical protein DPMN_019716 [Dreissena polymorpha]